MTNNNASNRISKIRDMFLSNFNREDLFEIYINSTNTRFINTCKRYLTAEQLCSAGLELLDVDQIPSYFIATPEKQKHYVGMVLSQWVKPNKGNNIEKIVLDAVNNIDFKNNKKFDTYTTLCLLLFLSIDDSTINAQEDGKITNKNNNDEFFK